MVRMWFFLGAVAVIAGAVYLAFWYIPNKTADPLATGTAENTTPVRVETHTLAEDTQEYSIDVEYPHFGIPAFDEAIEKAVESAAKSLRDQAATDTPVAKGFRPYELSGGIDSTYVGEDIASARIVLGQDFGGAHPLPVVMTFNFDRTAGKEITLDGVLSLIGLTLPQMAAQAKVQLDTKLGRDIIAPEGADPKPENYQTFTIDADSVTFIFQPYQVAPYAAGAPEVDFARK